MLLRMVHDDAFGRQEHTGYGSGVLQCHTCHFGRVNHAGFEQLLVLVGACVVAEVAFAGTNLVNHYCAFFACVGYYLTERFLYRTTHDLDTCLLVLVGAFQVFQSLLGTDVHHAAARNDTFFDCRTRCAQSVVHTVFLLFHLHLAGCTYVQLCYAACQFGKTLLQLLFVIGGLGRCYLCFDLCHTGCDGVFVACAVDDGGVVFVHGDGLSGAEHLDGCLLKLDAFLLADDGAAGEDSDVFQHLFAAVAEARSLHGADLQLCTQTVDNQCCQCLAVHILCDDEQRSAALYCRLQDRKQLFEVGDFLVIDKDIGLVHLYLHRLCVCHEIRADISAVELHTLYHVNGGVHSFGLTDGDYAVFAHFAHRVGNQLAYLGVVVGGDGGYLLDLVEVIAYDYGIFLDFCHYGSHGFVDTAFQVQRVGSGCHVLQTHAYDGLCQNGSGRCSVTGLVACLGCHFFDQLCSEVLCGVCQLNLFGYCHTVFGDVRSAVFLVNHYIASLRTQRHFHCVSQLVNASLQRFTRLGIVCNILCHNI